MYFARLLFSLLALTWFGCSSSPPAPAPAPVPPTTTTTPPTKAPPTSGTTAKVPAQVAPTMSKTDAKTPLSIVPMDGPFADIQAICKSKAAKECGPIPEGEAAAERFASSMQKITPLSKPFSSARLVYTGDWDATCYLVVEMGDALYVEPKGFECFAGDNRSSLRAVPTEFAVRDVMPGGDHELLFRYKTTESYANMDNDGIGNDVNNETTVVCGVGASGKPSCFSLAVANHSVTEPYNKPEQRKVVTFKLTLSFEADTIVIEGDEPASGASMVIDSRLDHRGRHTLVFP